MTLTRSEWNVAVVGHWNRAILTPEGITRRLFQLEDNANISIEIPADGLGPYRVIHAGLVVTATDSKLLIAAEEPNVDKLNQAIKLAKRAVETLPETPLRAAGMNLRFKVEDAPAQLFDMLDTGFKNKLSEQAFIIKHSVFRYSVNRDRGLLNIELGVDEQQNWALNFNFHIDAVDRSAMLDWLNQDASNLYDEVLEKILVPAGLNTEQIHDVEINQ